MIQINEVSFQYKNSKKMGLEHIKLHIDQGDFVGIIGNSGAGKTTLTRVMNGMVPHHFSGDFYGEALIKGKDSVCVKPEELARFVGSVFQDIDAQMVASVVEDELLFGLENFGVPKQQIEERMMEALRTVGIEKLRFRNISSLSGGQKQKVAIAAIIALKPEVLILDEPTGELDPVSSRQIFDLLKKLNESFGVTVVVVEQKVMLLCEFAKKLLVMEKGRILFYDSTKEVLKQSEKLKEIGINVPRIISLSETLKKRGHEHSIIPRDLSMAKMMVEEVLKNA